MNANKLNCAIPEKYRIIKQVHRVVVMDDRDSLVGVFAPFKSDALLAEDVFEPAGENLIRWSRNFTLKPGQQRQQVRLTMDFEAAHKSRFSLIPGISWDGNRNDPGNVYRDFSYENTPWSFASHRTLIPGATYSEGERHTVGMFADVGDPKIGMSCSLIPGEESTIHRLIFPEEELPRRVLIRERGLSLGRANVLELAPGEQFEATAYLVLHPLERPKTGYRYLLDAAWTHFLKNTSARFTAEELWTMGVRFAKESLWDERAEMFHTGLVCEDKQQWKQVGFPFSIGWCGRNGDLACALMADYLKSGDKSSLDMALECLDAWAGRVETEGVVSPPLARFRGLAFEGFDANTLSDGATAFLKAYQMADQCGTHRPRYLTVGLGVCDAALTMQKPDGRFEGAGCERGAIGAAFIPPLLTAYEMTKKPQYIDGAQSAMHFYMEMFYRDGCLWGGALDTRSVDKETVLPLMAGSMRLYELTGDSPYLRQAEDAAYYFAAWQIAQAIPNPSGSLMDAVGYDTFGGTSVATVHMCADSFGVKMVPNLLQLAKHTGRDLWT